MGKLLCFAASLLNEKDKCSSRRNKARVVKEETREEAIALWGLWMNLFV